MGVVCGTRDWMLKSMMHNRMRGAPMAARFDHGAAQLAEGRMRSKGQCKSSPLPLSSAQTGEKEIDGLLWLNKRKLQLQRVYIQVRRPECVAGRARVAWLGSVNLSHESVLNFYPEVIIAASSSATVSDSDSHTTLPLVNSLCYRTTAGLTLWRTCRSSSLG